MNIQELTELSGLTRGQINQMISRHGFLPHGGYSPGNGRQFTDADAFNFILAGALAKLGLDQPTIIRILHGIEFGEVDPNTFEQLDIFPGYSALRKEVAYLVIQAEGPDEFCCSFTSGAVLLSRVDRDGPAIVLNASAMAELVVKHRGA